MNNQTLELKWTAVPADGNKPPCSEVDVTDLVKSRLKGDIGRRRVKFTIRKYPRFYFYTSVWSLEVGRANVDVITVHERRPVGMPLEPYQAIHDFALMVDDWLKDVHIRISSYRDYDDMEE